MPKHRKRPPRVRTKPTRPAVDTVPPGWKDAASSYEVISEPSSPIAYFFVQAPEVLPVVPGPHYLDIDSPMPGTGNVRTSLRRSRAGTGAVVLTIHQTTVGSSEVGENMLTLMRIAMESQPWAFPNQRQGDSVRSGELATETTISVVEAAVQLPMSYPKRIAEEEELSNPMITAALGNALDAIAVLQLNCYSMTRRPLSRVTPETLPYMIPYVLHLPTETSEASSQAGPRIFLNDAGKEAYEFRTSLGQQSVDDDLFRVMPQGPFAPYQRLRLEAESLLNLNGEYRAMLLTVAAACENLVDTTLMLLLWEAGEAPESAARFFGVSRSVTERVAARFHGLLGGDWDITQNDELGNWTRQVVYPRNEAIHTAAPVDRDHAMNAWIASEGLRFFLASRLKQRASRYPMTSLFYFVSLQMEPRGGWSQRMRERFRSETLPHADHFDRWANCLREVVAEPVRPREPTMQQGHLLTVISPGGFPRWIWHSPSTAKACEVLLPEQDMEDLLSGIDHVCLVDYFTGYSHEYRGARDQISDWEEEHWLIPGLEALNDGSDLEVRFEHA